MRVALDATPLLGRRTGVGQYATRLAEGLGRRAVTQDLDVRLVPFTLRGAAGLDAPPGTSASRRRFPARLLQQAWMRGDFPPVEALSGRCDVFHATNFVLPPRLRAAGVVTVHDLTFIRFPAAVTPAVLRFRTLVPRSVGAADLVLCPSRATADDVAQEYGLDPARVLATPLGVEPAWFDAEPARQEHLNELGLPHRYVVFVGTREPRKDLATLIAAHDQWTAADPSAPDLVLAGPSGWGEQPGAGPRRHLVDYLPAGDLRSLVAGAAALVLPSRYEGFGLPLLEALACGVPVLASDLPVHREVAGSHATFVAVGDVDGLTAALDAVTSDDGGPEARLARRAWAARWTWDTCVEATVEAYRVAAGAR